MAVVASHEKDILALAQPRMIDDETLRRLGNYAGIQKAWCFWNLVPGGIADETSPFNLCMHAYLAALRAMLLRMDALEAEAGPVAALVTRVERDMMREGAALQLCRYSGGQFDTANPVGPDWPAALRHPPTLLTVLAGAGLLAGIALFLWRLGRPGAPKNA